MSLNSSPEPEASEPLRLADEPVTAFWRAAKSSTFGSGTAARRSGSGMSGTVAIMVRYQLDATEHEAVVSGRAGCPLRWPATPSAGDFAESAEDPWAGRRWCRRPTCWIVRLSLRMVLCVSSW